MNNLAHFAIHAEDTERARSFYESVFDWQFNPYGPPNFYQIATGGDGDVRGALQEVHGEQIRGFECTISVTDLDATLNKVKANGGTIVLDKCVIPSVGWLFKFHDTEGNLVVAMQYDDSAT